MARKLIVSDDAAKSIVRNGSPQVWSDRQIIKKPITGQRHIPTSGDIDRHLFDFYPVGRHPNNNPGTILIYDAWKKDVGEQVFCHGFSADIFQQGFTTTEEHFNYFNNNKMRLGIGRRYSYCSGDDYPELFGSYTVFYRKGCPVLESHPSGLFDNDGHELYNGTAYSPFPIVLMIIGYSSYPSIVDRMYTPGPRRLFVGGNISLFNSKGSSGCVVALPSREVFEDTGLALVALGNLEEHESTYEVSVVFVGNALCIPSGYISFHYGSDTCELTDLPIELRPNPAWNNHQRDTYSRAWQYLQEQQNLNPSTEIAEAVVNSYYEVIDLSIFGTSIFSAELFIGTVSGNCDACGDVVVNNYSGDSYICNSPLSHDGDVFVNGQKVIVHRNIQSGTWNIINAECI